MKEIFFVKEVTAEILVLDEDEEIKRKGYLSEGHGTYEEAVETIKTLPKGYYKVEKIFMVE